jgi:hypothetical protein
MTNFEIAKISLDGLIAGLESGSEIPVQLCELVTLRLLLIPAQSEAAAVVESRASWRNIALQFDAHRMNALWHLRMLVAQPDVFAPNAEAFLIAKPLTGAAVLAQRTGINTDALDLLDKVLLACTRDDDLPDGLVPRIEAFLKGLPS